jgi:hypothetical protein
MLSVGSRLCLMTDTLRPPEEVWSGSMVVVVLPLGIIHPALELSFRPGCCRPALAPVAGSAWDTAGGVDVPSCEESSDPGRRPGARLSAVLGAPLVDESRSEDMTRGWRCWKGEAEGGGEGSRIKVMGWLAQDG